MNSWMHCRRMGYVRMGLQRLTKWKQKLNVTNETICDFAYRLVHSVLTAQVRSQFESRKKAELLSVTNACFDTRNTHGIIRKFPMHLCRHRAAEIQRIHGTRRNCFTNLNWSNAKCAPRPSNKVNQKTLFLLLRWRHRRTSTEKKSTNKAVWGSCSLQTNTHSKAFDRIKFYIPFLFLLLFYGDCSVALTHILNILIEWQRTEHKRPKRFYDMFIKITFGVYSISCLKYLYVFRVTCWNWRSTKEGEKPNNAYISTKDILHHIFNLNRPKIKTNRKRARTRSGFSIVHARICVSVATTTAVGLRLFHFGVIFISFAQYCFLFTFCK